MKTETGNRERVYDEKIAHLMTEIIAVCKGHGIPMMCSFALDGDLACTSAILNGELNPPEAMIEALKLLRPRKTMKITTTDKDGVITNQTIVFEG